MNKPQKPENKKIDPLEALKIIGETITAVDIPVKQFKREEYDLVYRFIVKMIRDGVVE
jgi:hypothetical protein